MNPRLLRRRGGFTMVEVMIASALLGFSLIVMFGFHGQAVRANMNARRLTDCTYLAQTQMERLMAMDWGATTTRGLTDLAEGSTGYAALSTEFDDLEHPTAGATEVNAMYDATATTLLPVMYRVTWDVEAMDGDETWLRLRVRCTYEDSAFNTTHGTTISSFRFRDS
ncbi:MAG: type IV pilus modification PilV family protein [Myxococcota bacterium]